MPIKRWAIYCPQSSAQVIIYTEGDKKEIDVLTKYHGKKLSTLIARIVWGHYAIETPYNPNEKLNVAPILNCWHPKKV